MDLFRKQKKMFSRLVVSLGCVVIILGCDNSFEPLKENNLYNYSMFGILDLSADTQWVRVAPIRSTIFRDSSAINNATVTMIRESDGHTVQLKDTLIRLPQNSYVWNYWTTEELVENEFYTIRAESPAGDVTKGTAYIPLDIPDLELFFRENTGNCHVIIDKSVERIAVAEITYRFRVVYDVATDFINFPISYVNSLGETIEGDYELLVNDLNKIASEWRVSESQIIDLSGKILLVSADSNWVGLDVDNPELYGANSNIQNGLGVITGIVSKEIPLRPTREGQQDYMLCPPREL